jgi:hypothetical protein
MILPQMQESFVNTLAGYQPYSTTGQQGLTATTDLLGLNGPDAAKAAIDRFQTSPGYQFQMEQGLRAIDAGAAAGQRLPGVRSGATLKAEETFGQELANQDFGNYYNRLSALSGQGLTAAQGIGAANQNLISQEEGNANSQNAAITNMTNAQNSATGNLFSGLGNTANNLLNNQAFLNLISPSSNYGNIAPGTPRLSTSGNPVMTGFAPAYSPGQTGVGGFVVPTAPSQYWNTPCPARRPRLSKCAVQCAGGLSGGAGVPDQPTRAAAEATGHHRPRYRGGWSRAAPLLGASEDDAAKAYPGWLQDMQSRGLARHAPPTYPGHATTAALVQRAMPLIDQYKMGLMTSPGTQAILIGRLHRGWRRWSWPKHGHRHHNDGRQ